MNFIWYPIIEAFQLGLNPDNIQYRVREEWYIDKNSGAIISSHPESHFISPLLEYLPSVLYDKDIKEIFKAGFLQADVNPYYRFERIFSFILSPYRNDPNDLIISDIIIHMLAEIDRISGMDKRDYYLLAIAKEIENGCFGEITEGLFSLYEKVIIAESLITLYKTSNSFRCLDMLFKVIMTGFNLRIKGNEEIEFYNPGNFNELEDKKLRFVIKLFLPINIQYVIHWRYTYGTIGQDESMVLEEFVI